MSTNKDTGSKAFSTAILVVLVLAAVAGAYMIGKNNGGKSSDNSIALAAPANTSSTGSTASTNGTTSTSSNKTAQNGSTKSPSKTARLQSYGFFYLAGKVNAVDGKTITIKTDNGQIIKVAYESTAKVIYPVASKVSVVIPKQAQQSQSTSAKTGTSSSTPTSGGTQSGSSSGTSNSSGGSAGGSTSSSTKNTSVKDLKVDTAVVASIKINDDGTFVIRSVRINKQ